MNNHILDDNFEQYTLANQSWLKYSLLAGLWIVLGAVCIGFAYGEFPYMRMIDLQIVDAVWWSRFVVFAIAIYFSIKNQANIYKVGFKATMVIATVIALTEGIYGMIFNQYDNNYRVELHRNLQESSADPAKIEKAWVSVYTMDWKSGGGIAVAGAYGCACMAIGMGFCLLFEFTRKVFSLSEETQHE